MERSVLNPALSLTSTRFIFYLSHSVLHLNLFLSFSGYDVAGQFQECVFVW
jgi:hypothetical protein